MLGQKSSVFFTPAHTKTHNPDIANTLISSSVQKQTTNFQLQKHNIKFEGWKISRSGARKNSKRPVLAFQAVLWIRDILARIRIRGSGPLTLGSGSGSSMTFKRPLKISFCIFFIILQRQKSNKSPNSRNQGFSYYFCLMMEDLYPETYGSTTLVLRMVKPPKKRQL
jgi:hypothetical protein